MSGRAGDRVRGEEPVCLTPSPTLPFAHSLLEDSMRLTVHLFGDLRRYLPRGQESLKLDLPEGATAAMVLETIGIHPGEVWLVRANRQIVAESSPLHDADDLEIFEPIGGGQPADSRQLLDLIAER
jgi:sulfur carrier protein ThiS